MTVTPLCLSCCYNPSSRECKHATSAKHVPKLTMVMILYTAVCRSSGHPCGVIIIIIIILPLNLYIHTSYLFPAAYVRKMVMFWVCLTVCVLLLKALKAASCGLM